MAPCPPARGLLAILLLCVPGTASAWAPETRLTMVDEVVRLMPASLRLALESHRIPLQEGSLDLLTSEGGPAHLPPWRGGTLDAEVAAAASALIEAVEKARPFGEVARRFGALAHWIADAGYPPGVSRAGGDSRYAPFASFVTSRRERFPLVFYGYDDPRLDASDFRGYARHVMERAASEDLYLERAYRAAGTPPDPAAFDDRSVPFAVASLAYSRAVTDIARVWFAAWRAAHGDTGKTPYRETTPRAGGGASSP